MRISFCVEDVDHWLPWLKDEKLFTKFTRREILDIANSDEAENPPIVGMIAILNCNVAAIVQVYIAVDKSVWVVIEEHHTPTISKVIISATHKTHSSPLNEVFWSPLQTIFDHLLSTVRITTLQKIDLGMTKVIADSQASLHMKHNDVDFPAMSEDELVMASDIWLTQR